MSPTSDPTVPSLAVVVYEPGYDVGPLLCEVRDRLAARGDVRLGGVVPRFGGFHSNGRQEMLLEDVTSGDATPISQELGGGADACILDTDGLTRARMAISRAIAEGVDLVLVGKFSKQEAAGHGVRDEIAEAMMAGIPTLAAMRETQREAWEAFVGDDYASLAPDAAAIVDWAVGVLGKPA